MSSLSISGVGGQALQNWMEGVWMRMVVAWVQQDPRKVCQGGGEESRSASGGGTGRTDLVEEVEWLDEENEEDRVRAGL